MKRHTRIWKLNRHIFLDLFVCFQVVWLGAFDYYPMLNQFHEFALYNSSYFIFSCYHRYKDKLLFSSNHFNPVIQIRPLFTLIHSFLLWYFNFCHCFMCNPWLCMFLLSDNILNDIANCILFMFSSLGDMNDP